MSDLQEEIAKRGWAMSPTDVLELLGKPDVVLIDLREPREREKHGTIPGSLHAPYPDLQENVRQVGCSTSLRLRQANASCSTAPSANDQRWQCRPRRTPGSALLATFRVASERGRRSMDPWSAIDAITLRIRA